jgi:hypothetical protein
MTYYRSKIEHLKQQRIVLLIGLTIMLFLCTGLNIRAEITIEAHTFSPDTIDITINSPHKRNGTITQFTIYLTDNETYIFINTSLIHFSKGITETTIYHNFNISTMNFPQMRIYCTYFTDAFRVGYSRTFYYWLGVLDK